MIILSATLKLTCLRINIKQNVIKYKLTLKLVINPLLNEKKKYKYLIN